METKLQLALDVLTIEEALEIVKKSADYIDIIELGTPLLKEQSADYAIKMMKANFADKLILADLKTMDTGEMEAKLAFKAGADISTVCGAASIETIKEAVKTARKMKKKIVVDLIGVKDKNARAIEILEKARPDYFCVHTGIDEKNAVPFSDIKKIAKTKVKICVAGGVNLKTIRKVMKFKPAIIVVGRAVTKAKNPGEAARLLASIIKGKKIKAAMQKPRFLPNIKMHLAKDLNEIEKEIKIVLGRIDAKETNMLLQQILQSERIFITGQGRSGLIGEAFAMRLTQLDMKAFVVGEATTPAISKFDILIAISGTGRTEATLNIVKKAKAAGANIAIITSNPRSPIAKLAGIFVRLNTSVNGKEPLGSLFEQAALLYLDSLVIELMKRTGKTNKEMRKMHANL